MSVKIEESFQVAAPADLVWSYLVDPTQVVGCLPGASLTEVVDDDNFLGTVKVKVGPVTASYKGKVQIVELDEANRQVRMVGEGMESSGAGSAKMTLSSQVTALPDGRTEVSVEQEVEVVGKLAQFGRGMVAEVGKQLFRQFVDCAGRHLEGLAATAASGAEPETAAEGDEGAAPAAEAAPAPPPPPAGEEAVSGLSVFFKALWSLVTRPFRSG